MNHHEPPTEKFNEDLKKQKKTYWRSAQEFERDPNVAAAAQGEFAITPFTEGFENEDKDENARREFLKVMGASIALAGASACARKPTEKILPYNAKPEHMVLGEAYWYASTCAECESGCGIVVKTREGRPIKFEGNPAHSLSKGGLCARGQASILNLYDPDRLKQPVAPGRRDSAPGVKWADLDAKLVAKLDDAKRAGGKVRFLTGEINSPSAGKLVQEFLSAFGSGKRVTYDVLGSEEVAVASEMSYGSRVVPHYRFDKADFILGFGADFLGSWGSSVEYSKAFSKNRKAETKKMSRFVAFESLMTLTGSNADKRYTVKAGDEVKVAGAIAHELIVTQGKTRFAGDSDVRGTLAPFAAAQVASQTGVPVEAIKTTAQELWENRGRSLVVGGGHNVRGDNGVALEVLVNLINSACENDGVTVDGANATAERSSYRDLVQLISDMKAGQVDVLFIYRMNPLYTLPKALGFEEALSKVGTVVYFGSYFDETARKADFVATLNHAAESWGDASPVAGVYSIQQPTITPLHDTRSMEDSLMAWGKRFATGAIAQNPSFHEYVRSYWKDNLASKFGGGLPFELFWEKALREGAFGEAASSGRARSFSGRSMVAVKMASTQSGVALVLYPKIGMADGAAANNGWLQELPDPVTKIVWDNYLNISTSHAKKLGLSEGDIVRVKVGGKSVEVPAHIQPGMHDQTVSLAVGYGRRNAGRVGNGVGVNAFELAEVGKQALVMSSLAVTVEKTGKCSKLSCTQGHHDMAGREIVKEATLAEYRHNPHAGNEHHEKLITMWPTYSYKGNRWAMAIDLSACTGCSACVIGCQSENNIPIVGKKLVGQSREMHWLRIDRYYSGRVEAPETVHQPVMCQHCENAPCETVCPVLATMHDDEGLNQQAYNRCVGTRYCANNCPYKARRFNWFTFTDVEAPQNLAYNPDLTVRTRGIMEKCTFCVQRIIVAKDKAKDHGAAVADGAIKTACQQSCPTDAIVFGNINDKNSKVAKLAEDPRGYRLLEELNVKPSITYLTKIRNG